MVAFGTIALYALNSLFLLTANTPVAANPLPQTGAAPSTSGYWLAKIARNGKAVQQDDANYEIFRNVQKFGAVGDGKTDDSAAINAAISSAGNGVERCGWKCDSRTTQPALVYFPPGTYLVNNPIQMYYYTQMVGDATDLPVIKAAPGLKGLGVIDADPYVEGVNWYTNQNNFFRQIRNFVIDLTAVPDDIECSGIHWQVAQATSLQNIRFEMKKGNNKHNGIFMDNGSGGFMSDLTFNGGQYGAFLGSQQFTTRNMTFTGQSKAAIYLNWNWLWSFSGLTIKDTPVGIDMSNGPADESGKVVNQTVGSMILYDSVINANEVGVNTSYARDDNVPYGGGTVYLNNVDFGSSPTAVRAGGQQPADDASGGGRISSWAQGSAYDMSGSKNRVQGNSPVADRPAALLDPQGNIFARSKPQYEAVPVENFISIKSAGAQGDGKADDTQAIQKAINALTADQVLYFDHGSYLIHDTIIIPSNKNIKVTGEHWPLLLATGDKFADQNKLKPVFQVGEKAGDAGGLEMSDLIIGTAGPVPGATLMQWNLASEKQGESGLWDVHFRVGGYQGSELQLGACTKNNGTSWDGNNARAECQGAGLLFHSVKEAGNIYMENVWWWVSDHELDIAPFTQIDIFNGRGVLIESQGASWFYGTASEHNVLYNYQLNGAKNVFMSAIQTETPYYQGNPDATVPFMPQTAINDPDFASYCAADDKSCKKSWGLRVIDSEDFLLYGGGLYSFFENYGQTCVAENNCQTNMVQFQGTNKNVHLFGLSTKASVNMVTVEKEGVVLDADNRSNFCGTIARFSVE